MLLTDAPEPSNSALTRDQHSEDPGATAGEQLHVVFVGDSLTDFRSHGGGYIRELERHCPKGRFENLGKGGDMVNQMRRRFTARLQSGKTDFTHVVVFGGVNDLYSDLTAHRTNDKIQADLTEIYRLARGAGARVVALTVAPWGGFRRYHNPRRAESTLALNAWITRQAGSTVDWVVDAHALLRCGDPHELCPSMFQPFRDGLHFGREGHRILGQALIEQVFRECR